MNRQDQGATSGWIAAGGTCWRHKAKGQKIEPGTPVSPGLIPTILRLPTLLFKCVAAKMLIIDPEVRTSMSYDLDAKRQTEIDPLQGEIIAHG